MKRHHQSIYITRVYILYHVGHCGGSDRSFPASNHHSYLVSPCSVAQARACPRKAVADGRLPPAGAAHTDGSFTCMIHIASCAHAFTAIRPLFHPSFPPASCSHLFLHVSRSHAAIAGHACPAEHTHPLHTFACSMARPSASSLSGTSLPPVTSESGGTGHWGSGSGPGSGPGIGSGSGGAGSSAASGAAGRGGEGSRPGIRGGRGVEGEGGTG